MHFKHYILLALVLVSLLLNTGCTAEIPQIDAEEILRSVVDSIDFEELESYARQGADVLMEKYPSLKTLADQEKMKEILKDKGLDLMNEYLKSTEPEIQENANKLGQILKILYPELTDEVDAVLNP